MFAPERALVKKFKYIFDLRFGIFVNMLTKKRGRVFAVGHYLSPKMSNIFVFSRRIIVVGMKISWIIIAGIEFVIAPVMNAPRENPVPAILVHTSIAMPQTIRPDTIAMTSEISVYIFFFGSIRYAIALIAP